MATATAKTIDLSGYTGSDNWYAHPLTSCTYTDGVLAFAEQAGAYWFLDIVFSEYVSLQRANGFLVITLAIVGERALISVGDGNGNELATTRVEFTDCPIGSYSFYFCNDVLHLPSEY